MQTILIRSSRILLVSLSPLLLVFPSHAHADIFQWEYTNAADPSQGKRQSTTLAPDGAGVDAVPGADLVGRNLTMAYLNQSNLTNSDVRYANLTDATLSQANLTAANFWAATLSGADFSGAEVRGATFEILYDLDAIRFGTGISLNQLYSTASYHHRELSGINLNSNNLAGVNLDAQNLADARFWYADLRHASLNQAILTDARFDYAHLTNASLRESNLVKSVFAGATLTDADFTGADVKGASFDRYYVSLPTSVIAGSGITLPQLYSTANYQNHDLRGIRLTANDLRGANFVGQNLSGASLYGATLTDADFTNAVVHGVDFSRNPYYGTGITLAQLYSTASYSARDLRGVGLFGRELSGGNFAGQNLTNASLGGDLTGANFRQANLTNATLLGTLTDADFDDAVVRGANLSNDRRDDAGITLAQLYATASYKAHDLSGIEVRYNELSAGNFAGQNLAAAEFAGADLLGSDFSHANITNAVFTHAVVWSAKFTAADTRGARELRIPAVATTANLIRPDGHIDGLDLEGGGLLVVRDYDGDTRFEPGRPPIPITVDQHLAMGPGGTLRMVFEADAWDSTISFEPSIPVTLGGTLELTFADDVNLAGQVGRTFDLFDWTGVEPTGEFVIDSAYNWNLANLYTTGEVILTAIPEPASVAIVAASLGILAARGRCLRMIRTSLTKAGVSCCGRSINSVEG
jgi:uncharacterized protein YjbI with pentapeptide repeats